MTVNEMLSVLRRLQRDGRGHNTIFLHNESNVPVPHVEHITTHHNPKFGHVVISSDKQYDLEA